MANNMQWGGDAAAWQPELSKGTPTPSAAAESPHEALRVRRASDGRELDLSREVHGLFGLVFDAVTLDQAAERLRSEAAAARKCFVSTPNVNFVVAAQSDPAFRQSVLASHLSLADGMPIIWSARLLGIPIRQRVAGSDLFARLRHPGGGALRVYFFGGPDGIAERAAKALNADDSPLTCVGFDSPGFGSIEEISSPAQIERINASGADFVVVALGAKKGQAWIEHNLARIQAPLISHLGAVINFVAGSVGRAPVLWQRLGLEWVWRIKEEPALWRRYLQDGKGLLRLGATRLLPIAWANWRHRLFARPVAPQMQVRRVGDAVELQLSGDWTQSALPPLRVQLAAALRQGTPLRLDLSGVTWVDSAFLGLLLLIEGWRAGHTETVDADTLPTAPKVRRLMRWYGAA